MKKEMLKLLMRILIDIIGLAIDVFVECVWKPFLGTAVCFFLLYDILRTFLILLDNYINS